MISFAQPWFLLLLPLAAGPVLLHLLSLRRMNRTEFSSLFFLRRMRERRFRWLKLRDVLLLLLRSMFIAFLVLALSGPSWQGRVPFARVKADVIFIIDDSYSTSARFAGLKNTTFRLLDELAPGSRTMVLTSSSSLSDTLWENPEISRKAVEGLEPSLNAWSLSNPWKTAVDIMARSSSSDKRIIIVSDGQKRALEFLQNQRMPDDVEVLVFMDQARPPENSAITGIEIAPPFPVSDEQQVATVKIARYGNKKESLVGFKADKRLVEERNITLTPGTANFRFLIPQGSHKISFALQADSVPADDERFVLAGGRASMRIVLVGDANSDMLAFALEAGGDFQVEQVPAGSAGRLSPASCDLLIWDGASGLPPVAKALADYGLPVIVLLEASAQNLPGVSHTEEVSSNEGFDIPSPSALLEGVKKADIETIRIRKYVKVRLDQGSVILSLRNGSPLVWERDGIVYLATRLTPEHTDFVYRALCPAFVQRIALYAAGSQARFEYYTGDTLRIRTVTGNPLYLEAPKISYEVFPRPKDRGYVVEFTATSEPGFYASGSRDFVVNPDPGESNVQKLNPSKLEKKGIRVFSPDASMPSKLWLPLLILGVVCLALEFILIFI